MFSTNRYIFRSHRSTDVAVFELSKTIIDSKLKTIGIFLDIIKAFDIVSIPILFNKLFNVGVRGIALELFKNYLTSNY